MRHYPVSLVLSDKLCLVVGGGRVAERKVNSLLDCGARVQMVCPELTPNLDKMAALGKINYRRGTYQTSDLAGVFLVVCAVNNKEVNQRIAADCAERNLLVNVVDQPDLCNFIVPAIMRRGDLTMAVSTGGKSPLLARHFRKELEKGYGVQYEEYLDLLGELRQKVIHQVTDEEKKMEILAGMVSPEILVLVQENRLDLIKERLNSAYRDGGT